MDRTYIAIDEAVAVIRTATPRISGTETIPLAAALGRVTARDAVADADIPPFSRSLMDGYAVARADRDTWRVVGTVRAGEFSGRALADDEALAIMTGAPLPPNGVRVLMDEDVERSGDRIRICRRQDAPNIARQGEDLASGATVVPAGTLLSPYGVGSLVAAGSETVEVCRKVRIAWAVTGDELVPAGTVPGPGQIRDINSCSLAARLAATRLCQAEPLGRIPDSAPAVRDVFGRYFGSDADLLIVSGGAGRGDHDFVLDGLEAAGAEVLFYRVRIQPGKPTILARKGGKLVLGLPGNPVAVLTGFEFFVQELLAAFCGLRYEPVTFAARLSVPFARRNAERTAFIPVVLGDGGTSCAPVRYNGSGHIAAYTGTAYVACIPEGTGRIEAGETVTVRQMWRNL